MAYETLINSFVMKPSHKPHYTSTKSLKKALKMLRKLFHVSQKHKKFLDESFCDHANMAMQHERESKLASESESESESGSESQDIYASDEECDNYANECREAACSYTTIW